MCRFTRRLSRWTVTTMSVVFRNSSNSLYLLLSHENIVSPVMDIFYLKLNECFHGPLCAEKDESPSHQLKSFRNHRLISDMRECQPENKAVFSLHSWKVDSLGIRIFHQQQYSTSIIGEERLFIQWNGSCRSLTIPSEKSICHRVRCKMHNMNMYALFVLR